MKSDTEPLTTSHCCVTVKYIEAWGHIIIASVYKVIIGSGNGLLPARHQAIT